MFQLKVNYTEETLIIQPLERLGSKPYCPICCPVCHTKYQM